MIILDNAHLNLRRFSSSSSSGEGIIAEEDNPMQELNIQRTALI
eukprot:CAMPEP_0196753034 /NCGR_PEP_ID=MMETSP1091-20130531/89318_1 /TAXON_ID=302021 /ORGANISM="Rhodomonas sp., Strain CCMP768" /LENGTH=43 /DNA_ID= /DNA_START= /DNA_END= /DNA_ORIENTATION=